MTLLYVTAMCSAPECFASRWWFRWVVGATRPVGDTFLPLGAGVGC